VLLTGDLAFVHDAGSLAIAAKTRANLTVVVLDNDGGGIFEMLPVAGAVERDTFERHFGTPHGLDLVAIARAYGVTCVDVATTRELERALAASIERPGVELIRVASTREANTRLHAELFAAVASALGSRS
jgi:2-succinyl-5-enolpyruvyl-6-hydroxy-3-cyclohexene-1-carboxylate synthase